MKKYLLLLPIFFFLIGHASAAGYSYSRSISPCQSSTCPADQTNFTVEVCANSTPGTGTCTTVAGLNQTGGGAHVTNSSGYDIVFSTVSNCSSGLLNWETEKYVASTGELIAWVNFSTLHATPDTIYMCYGNSGISTFQGGATGTAWDTNYKTIWHLPDGSSLSANDSTSNGNTGTLTNTPTATTGQIDGAASLASASSQHIDETNTAVTSVTAVTGSAWIKGTSFTGYTAVLGKIEGGGGNYYELLISPSAQLAAFVNGGNGGINYDSSGTNTFSTGTWYYLTFTYDASTGLRGYVNGSLDKSVSNGSGALTTNAATLEVGNDTNTAGRFFNGLIDETRISSIARSANWITTEYNNQSNPSTFETFGAETSLGGPVQALFVFFGRLIIKGGHLIFK